MKQIQLSSRTLPILAVTILATSCIYDKPPGDEFHRTLWKSDEVPLGPFDACTLTLEFLCDDGISITTTGKEIICFSPSVEENRKSIYGTYACDGVTATFQNLCIYLPRTDMNDPYRNYAITFFEAHRDGDILSLLWRIEGVYYPFTTVLHRLSEYEN